MRKKKIMLLGGSAIQMTATLAAKNEGYHVISVDYLPRNPAHEYADEYYNISTTDRDAVLTLAEKLRIDGIVSYASDVSAPTAAYVAEHLGLPSNPYESVEILTRKDYFRKTLKKCGLNSPEGEAFSDERSAGEYAEGLSAPFAVKPVDSSGSKGFSKFDRFEREKFPEAFRNALAFSRAGRVLVERFIEKDGMQTDGDIFMLDGNIVCPALMDQIGGSACAPFVPFGSFYPSSQTGARREEALRAFRKVSGSLGMRSGAFNYEYIFDRDGKLWILEIGPRNGGNLIPDIYREATGVDMAALTVRTAVGDGITPDMLRKRKEKCAASCQIAAVQKGTFRGIRPDDSVKEYLVQSRMNVHPGDFAERPRDSRGFLGIMLLSADLGKENELRKLIRHMKSHVKILMD